MRVAEAESSNDMLVLMYGCLFNRWFSEVFNVAFWILDSKIKAAILKYEYLCSPAFISVDFFCQAVAQEHEIRLFMGVEY